MKNPNKASLPHNEFVLCYEHNENVLVFMDKRKTSTFTITNAVKFKSLEDARTFIKENGLEKVVFVAEFEEAKKLSEKINAIRKKEKLDELQRLAENLTPEDYPDLIFQFKKFMRGDRI